MRCFVRTIAASSSSARRPTPSANPACPRTSGRARRGGRSARRGGPTGSAAGTCTRPGRTARGRRSRSSRCATRPMTSQLPRISTWSLGTKNARMTGMPRLRVDRELAVAQLQARRRRSTSRVRSHCRTGSDPRCGNRERPPSDVHDVARCRPARTCRRGSHGGPTPNISRPRRHPCTRRRTRRSSRWRAGTSRSSRRHATAPRTPRACADARPRGRRATAAP